MDLLVVDDNSPDGTGKLADELAAKHPAIHVLHRTEKSGLGRAYLAGFKWALEQGYEFVFELDGDFSHNPDDIPMFLEAAQRADLVLGSRYLNGIRIINWPLSRLMLSKCAAKYVQVITGMPITDPTGGYKCFSRRALEADQPEANQLQRLQLPDRDDPPALAARHEDRGGADRLHGAGPGPFQDVRPHHPGSLDHGLAALVPEQDAPPARLAARQIVGARPVKRGQPFSCLRGDGRGGFQGGTRSPCSQRPPLKAALPHLREPRQLAKAAYIGDGYPIITVEGHL